MCCFLRDDIDQLLFPMRYTLYINYQYAVSTDWEWLYDGLRTADRCAIYRTDNMQSAQQRQTNRTGHNNRSRDWRWTAGEFHVKCQRKLVWRQTSWRAHHRSRLEACTARSTRLTVAEVISLAASTTQKLTWNQIRCDLYCCILASEALSLITELSLH